MGANQSSTTSETPPGSERSSSSVPASVVLAINKASKARASHLSLDRRALSDVPSRVYRITSLEELNLNQNNISDVSTSITRLTSLKRLKLVGNALGRSVALVGGPGTGSFTPATSTDQGPLARSDCALWDVAALSELDLSINRLRVVHDAISKLQELTHLRFWGNNLTVVPSGVLKLKHLGTLDLSYNLIVSVPDDIGDLAELKELRLTGNIISDWPHGLCRLPALSQLEFSLNNVKSVDIPAGSFQALQQLLMKNNHMKRISVAADLPSLFRLDLSDNELESLEGVFERCKNVVHLHLGYNQLASLPEAIGDLQMVELLDLRNNNLTSVPATINRLHRLLGVSLSHNKLRSLPDMSQMSNLTELRLAGNQLTQLPDSLGSLPRLAIVDFSDNLLTSLPATLSKCAKIVAMTVSENRFSSFPKSILTMFNLRELNLSGNKITSIPDQFLFLIKLKRLFLADNLLLELPIGIGKLAGLTTLFLSGNQLKAVPESIGDLYLLHDLFLARNHLTTLPNTMSRLHSLAMLDLTHNDFTSVPYGLDQLIKNRTTGGTCNLVMDMSHNSVTSPMPPHVDLVHECMENSTSTLMYSAGHASMLGRRPEMQDTVCMIPQLRPVRGVSTTKSDSHKPGVVAAARKAMAVEALFSVFDGHAGRRVAMYLQENIQRCLVDAFVAWERAASSDKRRSLPPNSELPYAQITRDTLLKMNKDMQAAGLRDGSTALVAVIVNHTLHVVNVGDCRAVMGTRNKDGKLVPRRITVDHKPHLSSELKRVRDLGGVVTVEGRVNGDLAVARSLGDFHLNPYVADEGDFWTLPITTKDEFLILACDGVWDVMSDEAAVRVVEASGKAEVACSSLRDVAHYRGSGDNVSTVVLRFHHPVTYDGLPSPRRRLLAEDGISPHPPTPRSAKAESKSELLLQSEPMLNADHSMSTMPSLLMAEVGAPASNQDGDEYITKVVSAVEGGEVRTAARRPADENLSPRAGLTSGAASRSASAPVRRDSRADRT